MDLREEMFVYMPDATPIPEEVIADFENWKARPLAEREEIIRNIHDFEVGEEWNKADSWGDVEFTRGEINDFSQHILVEGDSGLPEWWK